MSFVQIFVHAVWSTKYREPKLTAEKRKILFSHMHENAKQKGIHIDTIGGYIDHVHCLMALKKDQSIAKIIQLIKGESAYWANKRDLFKPYLQWQKEYYACSIDYKSIQVIRDYILNQEEHHQKKTFDVEYEEFLITCGIEEVKN
jgi:putative transposase